MKLQQAIGVSFLFRSFLFSFTLAIRVRTESPSDSTNSTVDYEGEDACPTGSYKPWRDAASCVDCEGCPKGQFREGCGGTLSGNCKFCPHETFKLYAGKQDCSSCSCPPGQFRPSCGGSHAEKCRQCPEGTFNAFSDASRCLTCNRCPPGEFRSGCGGAIEGTCIRCATNQSASSGVEALPPSVPLFHCVMSGTEAAHGIRRRNSARGQQRVGCDALDFGTCESCSPGTFKADAGSKPCSHCEPCAPESYRSRCGGLFSGSCAAVSLKLGALARLSGIQAQAFGAAARHIFRAEIAGVFAALPGEQKTAGHVNLIQIVDGAADSGADEADFVAEEDGQAGVQWAEVEYEVVGFEEAGEVDAAAAALGKADAELLATLQGHPDFAALVDVETQVHPRRPHAPGSQGSDAQSSSFVMVAAIAGQMAVIVVCVLAVYRRKEERQRREARMQEIVEVRRAEAVQDDRHHPLGVVVMADADSEEARLDADEGRHASAPDGEDASKRHASAEERGRHLAPDSAALTSSDVV